MAKSIDIPININLGITKETAEVCVRLVNLFLENNPEYFITTMESQAMFQTQIYLVRDPDYREDDANE